MGHPIRDISPGLVLDPLPPACLQNLENNGSELGMAGKILSAWELQVKY